MGRHSCRVATDCARVGNEIESTKSGWLYTLASTLLFSYFDFHCEVSHTACQEASGNLLTVVGNTSTKFSHPHPHPQPPLCP